MIGDVTDPNIRQIFAKADEVFAADRRARQQRRLPADGIIRWKTRVALCGEANPSGGHSPARDKQNSAARRFETRRRTSSSTIGSMRAEVREKAHPSMSPPGRDRGFARRSARNSTIRKCITVSLSSGSVSSDHGIPSVGRQRAMIHDELMFAPRTSRLRHFILTQPSRTDVIILIRCDHAPPEICPSDAVQRRTTSR